MCVAEQEKQAMEEEYASLLDELRQQHQSSISALEVQLAQQTETHTLAAADKAEEV
jgi:hypothetical protein